MNKQETLTALIYASALWQNFTLPQNDEDKKSVILVWYDTLKDYDEKTVKTAMLQLSKVSDFCNVGKILANCEELTRATNGDKSDTEICTTIRQAIKSINKKEAFDNLSLLEQRLVGNPQQLHLWGQLPSDTVSSVIMSQIIKQIPAERRRLMNEEFAENAGLLKIQAGKLAKEMPKLSSSTQQSQSTRILINKYGFDEIGNKGNDFMELDELGNNY